MADARAPLLNDGVLPRFPGVRCVWEGPALLGEGPVWCPDDGILYFVDIKAPAILWLNPDGSAGRMVVSSAVGAIALRRGGGLVAALRDGLAMVDTADVAPRIFCSPEEGLRRNRFNDGKCDHAGRFWLASMDDQETNPTGSVWRLDPDLRATRMFGGFVIGNGFGWSPDHKTMYFTDSTIRTIFAFDFDLGAGKIGRRRVFATVPESQGYPDGLCIDADGYVWSAHWDGWCITRYRPDGSMDRVVPMPVPRPTSLAFGKKALDRLFVTSARHGLPAEALERAPLSGGLFELDVGATGMKVEKFVG